VRFFFIAYSALAKLRWLMVVQGCGRYAHACTCHAGFGELISDSLALDGNVQGFLYLPLPPE